MSNCVVIGPRDHAHHHVGEEESSCFYFAEHSLETLVVRSLVGRFCRIEVSDKEAKLHKHAGATFVIVTSGSGTFRDENGVRVVRQGDMIYVPPDTPHLSIADKKTTMIEMVVYIGESGDMQASLSV